MSEVSICQECVSDARPLPCPDCKGSGWVIEKFVGQVFCEHCWGLGYNRDCVACHGTQMQLSSWFETPPSVIDAKVHPDLHLVDNHYVLLHNNAESKTKGIECLTLRHPHSGEWLTVPKPVPNCDSCLVLLGRGESSEGHLFVLSHHVGTNPLPREFATQHASLLHDLVPWQVWPLKQVPGAVLRFHRAKKSCQVTC